MGTNASFAAVAPRNWSTRHEGQTPVRSFRVAGRLRQRRIAPARGLLAGLLLLTPLLALAGQATFRGTYDVPRARLGIAGANPYLPLTPGLRLTYRGHGRVMVRTILGEPATVDGVQTRVVEDREERYGLPVEISRDHYAVDKATGDLYYFGERVDNYRAGRLVSHEGTWLAGRDGAAFGLLLAGHPELGDRYYEELAPGRAMDRAEVVGMDDTVVTPSGTFEHCVHLRESSPLDKGTGSEKWFAPGVGMVKDDEYSLVKIQRPTP